MLASYKNLQQGALGTGVFRGGGSLLFMFKSSARTRGGTGDGASAIDRIVIRL